MISRGLVLALTLSAGTPALRSIPIEDSGIFPESVAAASDGTLFTGSVNKPLIYRALPGAASATPWIDLGPRGVTRTMGLLVDSRRKWLWICTFAAAPEGGRPPATILTLDLATGREVGRYAMGESCNDMAIARDGTVYASDFAGGRILRLAKGDTAFLPWAEDTAFATVDGLALIADGSLIANGFRTGRLFRVPIGADGAAGKAVQLNTSRPLVRPDGMRPIGGNALAMIEGEGRLDRVTIEGDNALITPIREAIANGPTGVALANGKAFVSIGNFANRTAPDAATARSAILVVSVRSAP